MRPFWDNFAPLVRFAELFHEPALADTGEVKGTKLQAEMLFRMQTTSQRPSPRP